MEQKDTQRRIGFPWMKEQLEAKGCKIIVPQFPSPPEVPAKIPEWLRY